METATMGVAAAETGAGNPVSANWTGIAWASRPAERLASELRAGAGPIEFDEAMTALSARAVRYEMLETGLGKALAVLRVLFPEPVVGAATAGDPLAGVVALRAWVESHREFAEVSALEGSRQADNYRATDAAMPPDASLSSLARREENLRGTPAGAPSLEAIAAGELLAVHDDRARVDGDTARAMINYEATAAAWIGLAPPEALAPGDPQAADRTRGTGGGAGSGTGAGVGAFSGGAGVYSAPPPPLVATTFRAAERSMATTTSSTTGSIGTGSRFMPPPGMLGAALGGGAAARAFAGRDSRGNGSGDGAADDQESGALPSTEAGVLTGVGPIGFDPAGFDGESSDIHTVAGFVVAGVAP